MLKHVLTCDRCGNINEAQHLHITPKGWHCIGVIEMKTMENIIDIDEFKVQWTLCPTCTTAVRQFITKISPPASGRNS